MALRLRRGTDAERLLITPAEGELIYTTDTKRVYIGDGVTPGGIRYEVSGLALDDLEDIDLSGGAIQTDSVLQYNGADWVPNVLDSLSANINYSDGSPALDIDSGNLNVQTVNMDNGDDSVPVSFNTTLGKINFSGYDGDDYTLAAEIIVRSAGTAQTGKVPGAMVIATSKSDGAGFHNYAFTQTGIFVSPRIISNDVSLKGDFEGNFVGSVFADDSTEIIDAINGAVIGKIQLTGGAPTSDTAVGKQGEIRFDSNFMYVCTASDTWKRIALDGNPFTNP